MPQTISTTEPFIFPGQAGAPGCLLIHGFTSTPKEMRWMGEYLNGQGFNILGLRVAGHATCSADLARTRLEDWLTSMEDGYHLLRGLTDTVFLIGLSMGGNLSLAMSTRLDVAGVVAMSTPYPRRRDALLRFASPLSLVRRSLPKAQGGRGSGGWFGDAWKQHIAYPDYPFRSICEISRLLVLMRTTLPRVNVPVLLIQSKDDHPVIRAGMPKIHARICSLQKQMLWVEGSGHTLTEEPQRQKVFQAAADFMWTVMQTRV
jgi:carboxylesterase